GGFRDQHELLVEANHPNIEEVFDIPDTLLCTDPYIKEYIRFTRIIISRITNGNRRPRLLSTRVTNDDLLASNFTPYPYVDLPLLLKNDTAIHERGGLNWGQREGRESNQAYIPANGIDRVYPEFFPPLAQEFTIITDDQQQLICVMAQA